MSSETKNKTHPTPEGVQIKRKPQAEEEKPDGAASTEIKEEERPTPELSGEPEKPNHVVFMISTDARARETIFLVPAKDPHMTDDIIEYADGFSGEKSSDTKRQLLNLFGMQDSADPDGCDTAGKWSCYQITRACKSVSLDGIVLLSFVEFADDKPRK